MATLFSYSVADDTLNAVANPYSLTLEINASTILIAVESITVSGDVLNIAFKGSLGGADEASLDVVVAAHTGIAANDPDLVTLSEKKSPITNRLEVQVLKPEGSSSIKVSYDWTDRCTWYQKAIEVIEETLTDSGDGLTFNSVNEDWIDLEHGRLYDEFSLADNKAPEIYDNDVLVTSGYTLDYDAGDIVFDNAPTGPITANYWIGRNSCWILEPDAGKSLFIEHAELNFSADINMNSPVNFQIWVFNPYFNPLADEVDWFEAAAFGVDNFLRFPYQTIKYKNIKDVINSANLGQGSIPKVSGLQNDVLVFPFNYATVKPLKESLGTQLRVTIDNDVPMPGEWSTATFYVLSEDEV